MQTSAVIGVKTRDRVNINEVFDGTSFHRDQKWWIGNQTEITYLVSIMLKLGYNDNVADFLEDHPDTDFIGVRDAFIYSKIK